MHACMPNMMSPGPHSQGNIENNPNGKANARVTSIPVPKQGKSALERKLCLRRHAHSRLHEGDPQGSLSRQRGGGIVEPGSMCLGGRHVLGEA